MDRNNMRSSYVNSGPRSLPHMGGSKRHNGNGHNGNGHNGNGHGHGHGHGHNSNGHNGARLSPPMPSPQVSAHNNNNNTNQHDDLINYIYESWNKVTRDLERGGDDAKYYQEVMGPRQLANFRPFNLEEWWARRLLQTINRNKHRS
ncbi:uncharacterized protein LOC135077423 [Ostrinia nubilalis]|uniref:asparagine-rich protein-like n=1 Tax=Ostrinia furnacalis TaxID=93504 RepID=UPI00103DF50F|nr:asparagine-rich protein-like [Ostrinia furnacalis]